MTNRKALALKVTVVCILAVYLIVPFVLLPFASGFSPRTKAIVHVLLWPWAAIAAVLSCAGLLLLAARIAGIEGRSYIRALVIVAIGLGLSFAARPAYSALGLNKWVGIAINHVWFFLPVPVVFKASIPRSLLAYAIAAAMAGLITVLLAGLWMVIGMPLPS
jgi:hypothetical protein